MGIESKKLFNFKDLDGVGFSWIHMLSAHFSAYCPTAAHVTRLG